MDAKVEVETEAEMGREERRRGRKGGPERSMKVRKGEGDGMEPYGG